MKQQNGFTLLELLTVIAIIIILAGILIPAVGIVRQKAKTARAQADIESLCVALKMLETDFGSLPPSVENSNAFVKYLGKQLGMNADGSINFTPGANDPKYGPYMEFKSKDTNGDVFNDPWKEPYVYSTTKPAGPTQDLDFYIYSEGPNKTYNQGNPDDITNW